MGKHFKGKRLMWMVIAMLLQIVLIVVAVWRFNQYFVYFYGICTLFSVFILLAILNDKTNPAYKIMWIIPILLLPVFGTLFFLLFRSDGLTKHYKNSLMQTERLLRKEEGLLLEPPAKWKEDPLGWRIASYLRQNAKVSASDGTLSQYFPLGEDFFAALVEDLSNAKHFIFLEFFIIEEGKMWNTILEILKRKVREGVDVRLLYDDMGTIMTLPPKYDKTLQKAGIRCHAFNPMRPFLSIGYNHRDHRKIAVIDGYIGYTGGINLADEYINVYEKHGHWKDSGVRLEGDGVWNLTHLFLSTWLYFEKEDNCLFHYGPRRYGGPKLLAEGMVVGYGDTPLDDERVGESVYLHLINHAKNYIYITTPYLILDNEMVTALTLAAKSGVDVRLMLPHIPDKWYVHAVSRSHYMALLEAGVRIYEYTPGFVHAKNCVADDRYATVGSINLDYRSLYLHFESAVFFCGGPTPFEVKRDFLETLSVCEEITLEQQKKISRLRKLGWSVLRLFAPLM